MLDVGTSISVVSLLGLLVTVASTVWKFSQTEKQNREWVEAQIENVRHDMDAVEQGSIVRADSLRSETGEMGHALRTKIHEVEMWSRDTLVRKDSFEMVIGRLEKSIEKLTDKLETKIDRAFEHFSKNR